MGEKWSVSGYTAKPEPQIRCGSMRQREIKVDAKVLARARGMELPFPELGAH